ncbi:oxidoreductase family protein [Colletotrichum abscissum]|uniref:Oxidoreductase family protein n=1 Tax=Colletotrichum abscissum TaxID=1671311 RepID=A0A9P9X6X4_9PEZI|nr:oxidoreductase family protein [Colletotrichum abscissum]KAI3539264.1 oxidoreductase family protein [Colletotrichum abscissum]KAK1475937.1 oxidoreductase family protein [Colletotrichum abscissum]
MSPQVTNVGFICLSSRPEWSWAVAAHLTYFINSKHYNFAALQNSSREIAQRATRLHNLPQDTKADGDISALVSDPDVDLVAVTIRVHLHAAAVEAAIRAGESAVFCEWPLVRNSIEAERLTSLAREKGVRTLDGMSQVDKNFFWEITGTKGTLLIEGLMGNNQGFPPTIKFVKAEPSAVLEVVEVDEVKGFSNNTGKAWEAFAGGSGEAPDFDVALIRHRMLDAIYRSSELGTREEHW